MDVLILDIDDSVEMLRPLAEEWKSAALNIDFKMELDINIGLATMSRLKNNESGDVLVLIINDEIKGFIGLTYSHNHVGKGLIANECCFFVSESARSGGLKLIKAAEKLAKHKGCSFLTLNASKIAGDADRSGTLYERLDYIQFEVAYIKEL